jgi:hypothetical protein
MPSSVKLRPKLHTVGEAMTGRGKQLDWSKTWVAEMFLTQDEKDRRRGVTTEMKRNKTMRSRLV